MNIYDAIISTKNPARGVRGSKFGKYCTKHGATCGHIHLIHDATLVATAVAIPLAALGASHTGLTSEKTLAKGVQMARLIETRISTSPAEFVEHLPVASFFSTAVRELCQRALSLIRQDDTIPDVSAPYPTRLSPDFNSSLFKWWKTTRDATPCWRQYTFPEESASFKHAPPPRTQAQSPPRTQDPPRNPRPPPPRAGARAPRPEQDQSQRKRQQDDQREQRNQQRQQRQREEEQAQRRADERNERQQRREESNRAREETHRAERDRERAEEESDRHEEEERARNTRREEDEETREARDRMAFEMHDADEEVQFRLFEERQRNHHIPPPRPPFSQNARSVSLPPRLSPTERATKEAARAAAITANIALAKEHVASAASPEGLAVAEGELDAAIADARRYPAFPYQVISSGPSSALQAIDALHPFDYGVTYVHIPRTQSDASTRRLAEIQGALTEAFTKASDENNSIAIDRILKFTFASPALFLRASTRRGDSPQRRFDLYDKGLLSQLVAEFLDDARDAEDKACSDLPPKESDILSRVMFLLSRGEISKAVSAATPGAINDLSDPMVLGQLKARVGKKRQVEMPGSLPDDGVPYRRVALDVGKAYRSLHRLSGTGPDNVPSEILSRIARKFPGNPSASAAVDLHQSIADRYLEGSLPHWFYALESVAELIPLAKDLGSVDVRPISMTSTAARCWKAQAARQATKDAEIHFASVQFGAGLRGGAFTHSFAPTLFLEQATGDEAIVCLDIKNAFSTMDRSKACEALRRSTDPGIRALGPVFHAANSASLRPKGVDVIVEEGGGQGCPLMSVVFAETYLKPLLKLRSDVPGAGSFQDDTWAAGSVLTTLPAVLRLADDIKELGLELNINKCVIIPRDAAAVRSSLSNLSRTDSRYSLFKLAVMPEVDGATASWGDGFGFDIGGTPVGDDRYVHYAMDKVTHEAMADTSHITALLGQTSAQAAFAILRQSSVTRLNHVSMSVRPTISMRYLKLFDELIENNFNLLTSISTSGLDPTEKRLVHNRLRAPQRLGGVGLSNLGSNALHHYVNGFTMAVPRITSRTVDGKWIIGCIPSLSSVLGKSFSKGQADERFRVAASAESIENSPTCRSFYVAYRQLQKSVAGEGSTVPATGVLAVPVEAAGIKEEDTMA